jgi:predicted NUDIX family phosphoesterase
MKINFTGHQKSQREVELTQQELFQLFEVMKKEFMFHIEFGTFSGYLTEEQKDTEKLCKNHQVDIKYKKDRMAFFRAIIEQIENPYEPN